MTALNDAALHGKTFQVLYQIAEHATAGESLHDFTSALHRHLSELILARNLYMCLLNATGDALNFPYYFDERDGQTLQGNNIPIGAGLTEFVLHSQKPELIDQPRFLELMRQGEITAPQGCLEFSSWLGVPLQIGGKTAGALVIQSYEADIVYGHAEVQLLSFVAKHLSSVIERKQSYDALRSAHAALESETRQRRQGEAIYRVFYQLAASATENVSLHAFSAKVHELVRQLMHAPQCFVCLLGDEGSAPYFPYYAIESDSDGQEKQESLHRELCKWVMSTGQPRYLAARDIAPLHATGAISGPEIVPAFSCWLGVPLSIRGTIDGVLAVQVTGGEPVYTQADAELLAHVAHHVSGAIERQQAYASMHRSEERFRNVVEQVGQGMMVMQAGAIQYANLRAVHMLELSDKPLPEQGWTARVHPDDLAALEPLFQGQASSEQPTCAREFRLALQDGSSRWIALGATWVQWNGVPSILAFMSEITERKRLELDLRRTSVEREAMLNTALVGISFHVAGRIVWVNEKCAELVGMDRMALIGLSPALFFSSAEDHEAESRRIENGLHARGIFSAERLLIRKSGEPLWVLMSGRCVEAGNPQAGVIWTLMDITARRQAEEDIRQTLQRQQELNTLRSKFVSMTSHEFRTPLASIHSASELLRNYGERLPPEEHTSMLLSIESAVQHMEHMLNRILLIGKAEAEMLVFKPHPTALRKVFNRFIAEASLQQPESRSAINLRWTLDTEIVLCDEKLLGHIFSNLLSNALKYSPDGGIVQLIVSPAPGGIDIVVQDQGIGIPEVELKNLFNSFHRASNVGDIKGTGLGLSIVKKSVDLHGGRIDVRSSPGKGAQFHIFLPQPFAVL